MHVSKKLSERVAVFNKVRGMREYAIKNKISRNISIPLFKEEGRHRLTKIFNDRMNFSIFYEVVDTYK
jgi:hypothetical protein